MQLPGVERSKDSLQEVRQHKKYIHGASKITCLLYFLQRHFTRAHLSEAYCIVKSMELFLHA